MSNNNSPTVAMSSGFHSPFGVETPRFLTFLIMIDIVFIEKEIQLTNSLSRIDVSMIDGVVRDTGMGAGLRTSARKM